MAFVFVTDVQRLTPQSQQDSYCVPETNVRNILLGQNHIAGPVVDGTNALGLGPHLARPVVANAEVGVRIRQTVDTD